MSGEFGDTQVAAADPVTDLQRQAALAYARELLPQEIADAAAEDALAAFRHSVRNAETPPDAAARNELLLAVTRLMTAVSMPDRSSPADRRQAVWASIGAESHCSCRETGVLLAARANGNIEPRESVALDQHLAGCADCRALGVDVVRAEQGFRDILEPPSSGGGGLLRGVRGTALLSVGVVGAIAAGAIALTSGGGTTTPSSAFLLPTTTVATTATTPAKKATHHTHHAAAKHHTTKPKTVHKASTKPKTTASTADTAPVSSATNTPAYTPPTYTPPVSTPASTPAPTHTTAASTAGSTALAPTSESSLPAATATQQGIGATTTPSG